MGEITWRQRLLGKLRRMPFLHAWFKQLAKHTRKAFVSASRFLPEKMKRIGAPRGLYSEYSLMRSAQIPGSIIAESQIVPPIPEGSLRNVAGMGQCGHQPWPIFWTKHAGARLVGPTLVLMDERKRADSDSMFGVHAAGDPSYSTVFLPPPTRLNGNWTSIISLWCSRYGAFNYYHWLTDGLPRLAALSCFPDDTRILVPHDLPPYAWDSIRALGLENRVRETKEKHILIEQFFFSSPTSMTGCANPYAVAFLRKYFLPLADPDYDGPEKFFIRRKGKTRGLLNEDEIIRIFQENHWGIVDLEELTLFRQIKLFSKARAVCGLHGAGFTNLLWCQPGCLALELFASNFLNGCYESIASCVGVDHQYRIFPADADFMIRVDPLLVEKMLSIS